MTAGTGRKALKHLFVAVAGDDSVLGHATLPPDSDGVVAVVEARNSVEKTTAAVGRLHCLNGWIH